MPGVAALARRRIERLELRWRVVDARRRHAVDAADDAQRQRGDATFRCGVEGQLRCAPLRIRLQNPARGAAVGVKRVPQQRALRHLEDNRVVVFAGGTGNPFFTTDTTAVLRAAEMECDAVLKATNVDGVYSADPKKDPKAERYDRISLQEAFDRDLKVLDATAFALARENSMPIIVFSIEKAGAIEAVLRGKGRATVVSG